MTPGPTTQTMVTPPRNASRRRKSTSASSPSNDLNDMDEVSWSPGTEKFIDNTEAIYVSLFSSDTDFATPQVGMNTAESAVYNEFNVFRGKLVRAFRCIHARLGRLRDQAEKGVAPSFIANVEGIKNTAEDTRNEFTALKYEFENLQQSMNVPENYRPAINACVPDMIKRDIDVLRSEMGDPNNYKLVVEKLVSPLIDAKMIEVSAKLLEMQSHDTMLKEAMTQMNEISAWRDSMQASNFNIAEGEFQNLKLKLGEVETSMATMRSAFGDASGPSDAGMAQLVNKIELIEIERTGHNTAMKQYVDQIATELRSHANRAPGQAPSGASSSHGVDCEIRPGHCHHVATLMTQMREASVALEKHKELHNEANRKIDGIQVEVNSLRANPASSTQDPWFQSAGKGPGVPGAAGNNNQSSPQSQGGVQSTYGVNNAVTLGALGPLGNVASGKLFSDSIALDSKYQFNGSKDQGPAWREKVRGYLISKSPFLHALLPWAEAHDNRNISLDMVMNAVGPRAQRTDVELLNIQVWGFLRTCVNGTAETVHGAGEAMNGVEAWRRLVRHIDWGSAIHLDEMRTAVRHITLKSIKRLDDVAVGVLEFEKVLKRYSDAGGTLPPEAELKSDLLAILPTEMREHLLLRSTDEQISFLQFKDFIVTQSARILVARGRSPMLAALDEARGGDDLGRDEGECDDITQDELGELLAFAQRNGFDRSRGRRPPNGGGGAGAAQRRAPFKPNGPNAAKPRCANCGKVGHTKDECRQPAVPMTERPCYNCGKKGHTARYCPTPKQPERRVAAVDNGDDASSHNFGCFVVSHADANGWQRVLRSPKPRPYTIGDAIQTSRSFKALQSEDDSEENDPKEPHNRYNTTCTDYCNTTVNSVHRLCIDNSDTSPVGTRRACDKKQLLQANHRQQPKATHNARGVQPRPMLARGANRRSASDGQQCGPGQPSGCNGPNINTTSTSSVITTIHADGSHSDGSRSTRADGDHADGSQSDGSPSDGSHYTTINPTVTNCLSRRSAKNGEILQDPYVQDAYPSVQDAYTTRTHNGNAEDTTQNLVDQLANAGEDFHKVYGEINAKMSSRDCNQQVNILEYKPEENEILVNDEEVELEITQDSGAILNVLNPEDLPRGCEVIAGSNRPFVGANGGTIKNHGTADVDMIPEQGQGRQVKCRWTCADVTRPLISTGVTCDSGYEVLYTDKESLVVPKGALSKYLKGVMVVQRYTRQGKGLYTTKMKVKAHKASSFPRPSGHH